MKSSYAIARPIVNEYLVRERDRRRLRELAVVGAAVLLLGIGLLGYTWVHLEMLRVGYRIEALETKLGGLTRRERQLQIELAYLESPSILRHRAEEELGLSPPEPRQLISSDLLTAAGSASAVGLEHPVAERDER